MTTNETFTNALNLIKEGNIRFSLNEAEKLPFERFLDFIFYCREKQKIHFCSTDFWFALSESKYYLVFFNSSTSYLFLSSFFIAGCNKEKNHKLITFLAENQPNCLIKAIRVSKSFLKDKWYSLFEEILANHPNDYLQKHFKCFKLLRLVERDFWKQAESKTDFLNSTDLKPIDLLNELAIWYDLNTDNADSRQMQTNTELLNFVIDYLSKNNLLLVEDSISKESILKSNVVSFAKVKESEENHKQLPSFEWLRQVQNWIIFNNSVIQLYCFDLNYEPEISNEGVIYLKPVSIEKLKDWHNVDIKIKLFFDYYLLVGEVVFNDAKLKGEIQVQKDKAINQFEADQVNIARLSGEMAWLNTFLDEVIILNNKEISCLSISQFFGEYAGNCLFRWNKPLFAKYIIANNKNINSIKDVWDQNLLAKRDIQWLRHDSYNRLSENSSKTYNNKNSSDVINLFISNKNYSSNNVPAKIFDRFQISTNLFSKPFLKYGDNLFVFSSVMANTNPLTFLFDNLLNQNKNRILGNELSDKFEDRISNQFISAGFNTNLGNDKKYKNSESGEEGDIDALAYKDGCLFIIEAKLAPIRIALKDAHNELNNAFLKGASQLNKAVRFIELNFTKYKKALNIKEDLFTDLSIFPLIVSTSFESDHYRIEWGDTSYLKISWFELMIILEEERNPKRIINMIEDNEKWEIFDSLPTPSITKKNITIGSLSLVVEPNSRELFNQAIDLFDLNCFSEALIYLHQAIKLNENNVDFYIMLGDCYAELKDLESAKTAYETAIRIDPYYSKSYNNYGCFWKEVSNWDLYYQYLKMAIDINPFDEFIRKNFLEASVLVVEFGIRNEQEVDKVWQNLNKRIDQINAFQELNML